MVNACNVFVLLANLAVLSCQEQTVLEHEITHDTDAENPSYSFSYGVSDSRTGDIKTVWEAKEGDTVKGHYSVLEPDGSMRTVEYSAGPHTGFQATVNNDAAQQPIPNIPVVENKAMRDYDHMIDYSEVPEEEERYVQRNRKRASLVDGRIRDYVKRKRPQLPIDLEPSEYTHSYSIKHPYRDEEGAESESHISMDPNCKKKKKNENMYTSIADLDLKKYPSFTSNSFKEDFERYEPQSSYDFDKLVSSHKYGKGKFEDFGTKPSKYTMPSVPDLPSFDKYYPEDLPSRPKKKYKPYKKPEVLSDDLDDYILVPKKKYKNPLRVPDIDDYAHGVDADYERPLFDDDERFHSIRGSGSAPKEVIRKVVKKKKPVINLLDMFDI
ncbi:uncharacterized protein LOC128670761 [Plodia interpunctella]|uniref:uncharacterized protein LOC128670761 n=1 Tax=Plodia interpunctella TaxID=58824 RepID=UPI0023678E3B|nr:uncharacterized protein LOC128670761 [Plodia interpunctella]